MKIFNSKRKTVFLSKKLGSYLLYALGEIILVVAGILIALFINRWNIHKNEQKTNRALTEQVMQKMVADTLEIHTTLKFWDEHVEPAMNKVLYSPSDSTRISDCSSCQNLILGAQLPTLDDRVLHLIDQTTKTADSTGLLLQRIELHYKGFMAAHDFYNQQGSEAVTDNIKHLRDSYPWFSGFIASANCRGSCRDYFDHDPDYRNRVAYMELLLYDVYYVELREVMRKNRAFIAQLKPLVK